MPPSQTAENQEDAIRFCRELGPALLTYGAPAHRLEDVMQVLTRAYDIQGEIFSVPTAFLSSFHLHKQDAPAHLQRVKANEINLAKLAALDELFNQVANGKTSPQEGLIRLPKIIAANPPYGVWTTLLSFALASGCAARFFEGGFAEIFLATLTGLGLGILAMAAPHNRQIARLFEPLGAFVVALLATTCSIFWDGVSVDKATLGGLIILLPGFTLTLAIAELATRNLVSGTARLSAACFSFLMLGFGTAFGRRVGEYLAGPIGTAEVDPLPLWSLAIVLPMASTTIGILFRVPRRDLAWVFLVSMVGFLGVRFGAEAFGPMLGVFLGSVAVGSGSNLYARITDRPASITRLPGLLFLVPGGLGFLSLSALMDGDALQGLENAFQVAMVAIALVTGLLVSTAIISPRKAL